jgi:hypothetical protein
MSKGEVTLWVAIPLGCAIWVAANSTRYYPVFDEWVMIERATSQSVWRDLLLGFNGHMWTVPAAIYSLQVHLFDLQANWLAPTALVASLVALQLSLAGVLFRLGTPTPVALTAATVVTYFGPASETMVYQHLFGYNFALAFSCGAVFVALGRTEARVSIDQKQVRRLEQTRRRDRHRAVIVALLLFAALLSDSALAVSGLLFAGTLVLVLWPSRPAILALGPPFIGHAVWYFLDSSEVLVRGACLNCRPFTFSVPLDQSTDFALSIVTRSAGGLIGGGATEGAVLLLLAVVCSAFGLALRRLPREVIASLAAGVLATILSVGLFAYSRAGFWPTIDAAIASLDSVSNRYIQPAAIFLMLGFGPAVFFTLKPSGHRASRLFTGAATAGLILVFVVNLGTVWPTRDFYREWSSAVKSQVRQVVTVVSEGCAPGERLDRGAQPVGASYQISVRLVGVLLDRGVIDPDFGRPASPQVRAKVCKAT